MDGSMTPATFRAIRAKSGLSLSATAALLGIMDKSTIHRYETGARPISGPVTLLMRLLEREGADKLRGLAGD